MKIKVTLEYDDVQYIIVSDDNEKDLLAKIKSLITFVNTLK